MNDNCDICKVLEESTHRILVTEHWSVGLGNNHAYLGRAYVSLRKHKPHLSELSQEEWDDFQNVVKQLELAYKKALGADPLNWGCFMNLSYNQDPPCPHVHWRIFPRYKNAPQINGVAFEDVLYGQHYEYRIQKNLDDNFVEIIAEKLRAFLIKK